MYRVIYRKNEHAPGIEDWKLLKFNSLENSNFARADNYRNIQNPF